MKKLLFVFLALFSSLASWAENGNDSSEKEKAWLGFKFAVGASNNEPGAVRDDAGNFDIREYARFTIGAVAFVPVYRNIHLVTGLNYVYREYAGMVTDEEEGNGMFVFGEEVSANYLQIPLLARYNFRTNNRWALRWHIDGGFYAAYGISGKVVEKYVDPESTYPFDRTRKHNTFGNNPDNFLRPFDFGGIVGGGLLFNKRLTLDYNIDFSLRDNSPKGRYKLKPSYIVFSVGWVF